MALTKISGSVVQQNNFSLSGVVTATSFTGDLTGNITGNVTGTATTATNLADGANITTGTISNDRLPATITKNLTGDVTGNLTGDVTGNLTGNVSSSGANTLGSLTVTNDATVGGALTVTGNLTVNGTTTTIDTVVTAIDSLAVDGDVTAGGNLNITGVSTFADKVHLLDNDRLHFGGTAGQDGDLQIGHVSNVSTINDVGSGGLYVQSNGDGIFLRKYGGEKMGEFFTDGAVELYHDNSKKFETTGTGVTISGDARVTGILTVGQSSVTIDGTNNKITTPKLDYAGISSSISDTAVDVFVYDTRKDSDGGAWRKRTQHTSWYNETLNTATRGSRREFPAVAVIVSKTGSITIYDGDDPDLPMWMVFNGTVNPVNASGTMLMGNSHQLSVEMLNGVLVNGTNGQGTSKIKFISDDGYLYWNSTSTGGKFKGNISQRNSGQGYDTSQAVAIVNTTTNDVAMTVLPNAPIDSATGLPIPTIAVATNGGVSVIKDDGTVVNKATSSEGASMVAFTDTNKLIVKNTNLNYIGIFDDINTAQSTSYLGNITDATFLYGGVYESDSRYNYPNPTGYVNSNTDAVNLKDKTFAFSVNDRTTATSNGINLLQYTTASDTDNNGIVVGITTSYNTGWMHGNIKGAFLSDTDATNVTGSELVTNGGSGFSGTSGWYLDDTNKDTGTIATIAESSGSLVFTHSDTNNYWDGFGVSITTVVGESYTISADIAVSTDMNSIRITNTASQHDTSPYNPGGFNSAGLHSYTFIATATTTYIHWNGYASTATMTLDSFSVRLADPDRSVNNNGLQVFGTVTKSPVAGSGDTAAELVAYSGFSASNYLRQPYNSALDFGTGDLSVIFWYKTSSGSSQCILHRGDAADSGGGWGSGPIIQIEFNGTNLAAFLSNSGFVGYDTVGIPIATSANGVWNHYALTRSGGTMNVYFNGSLYGSTTSTRTLTNTSARTWIGERPNSSRPATNTSLALFRMGSTAPSAEQIKKIYEDEKVLFQENADCTLYGSSDAVTALAYDDSTNLLYAGTSSGRSDFQGLRRINNTTTAVTTAMSASNGLVAEQ